MAFDWEVDPARAATLGLLAGTLCAIGLFAAPFRTFAHIVQKKSTEQFSGFPYVATLLNCGVWVIYTLPQVTPARIEPLVTNSVGVVTQAGYSALFLVYAPPQTRRVVGAQIGGVVFFLLSLLYVALYHLSQTQRHNLVGIFAVLFTTLFYGSPLAAMRLVLRTRSVRYMPFWLSFNSLATSVVWLLYSVYVKDVLMAIPNVLGTLLGAFQMALYFSIWCMEARPEGYVAIQEDSAGVAPSSTLTSSRAGNSKGETQTLA